MVFALVNTLLVSALSIAVLYLLRLYKSRFSALVIPIAFAVFYGVISARDSGDWRELAEVIAPMAVLSPLCVWLFFWRYLRVGKKP